MSNIVLSLANVAARVLPMNVKQAVYRLPWLAQFVRGGLNRAAPKGMTIVNIAAGDLKGKRFALDLSCEKDYWLGTYEPELQEGIRKYVKPGMVVYDVGANIGYITLLLAQAVGPTGRVFSFEALPLNLERLTMNVRLNSMQDRVKIEPRAVSNNSAQVRFFVGPSNGTGKIEGSAGRQTIEYPESILVSGVGLDDFVYREEHPMPEVIKMDIEGGEVLALPGMRQVLIQGRPLVLIELHGPESANAAWKEFDSAGYDLQYLAPGYPAVHSLSELNWKSYLIASPR